MSTETTIRRPLLRRGLTAAALVAGGIVIGAGGLAVAGGEAGPMGGPMGGGMMGWHHHHHHGVGMLQHRVRGALDNVGATTAQEDKVHDIIAGAYAQIDKDKQSGGHGEMRRQLLELMKAPTLDRDAFEKLRAQKVSEMEAKSKVVSNALFDAASQLTPEQRAKLVAEFEARADHGWFGHHRDGEHGGGMDRGGDHGGEHDGEHGPGGHGPAGPDHG